MGGCWKKLDVDWWREKVQSKVWVDCGGGGQQERQAGKRADRPLMCCRSVARFAGTSWPLWWPRRHCGGHWLRAKKPDAKKAVRKALHSGGGKQEGWGLTQRWQRRRRRQQRLAASNALLAASSAASGVCQRLPAALQAGRSSTRQLETCGRGLTKALQAERGSGKRESQPTEGRRLQAPQHLTIYWHSAE